VVLVNGRLREGDLIVVCGLKGAIVTRIKALLSPAAMKEMRVRVTASLQFEYFVR
jgi:translation initiation factor 5B